MKAIFIAGLGAALLSSSTYAQQTQVVGQPVLRAPAPMAPEDLRSHPNFGPLRPTRCAGFSPMQDQREGLKDIARCEHTVETYRGAQAAPGVGAAPDTSASTSTRPMSATVRRCISMPAPLIARALRASGLARRTALAAPHIAFGLCDSLATRNGLGADRRPTRSASTG